MNTPPFTYEQYNLGTAFCNPSTVHTKNTFLYNYYRRYLTQYLFSVFDFKNIPDNWDKDFFNYCLWISGHPCILNTARFGVIPQYCTLGGYDVYYRPDYAIVANPLLPDMKRLKLHKDCEIIKLMPDYGGAYDIVGQFADMLALADEAAFINMTNSKVAYVFCCESKAVAESFKKVYDQINEGNPAAFADKKLFSATGEKLWDTFTNNIGTNYIVTSILNDRAQILNLFFTMIGIPNANQSKREQMLTDELTSNNAQTMALSDLWLKTLKESLEKVNKMFGLDIQVERNDDIVESATISSGALQSGTGAIQQPSNTGGSRSGYAN